MLAISALFWSRVGSRMRESSEGVAISNCVSGRVKRSTEIVEAGWGQSSQGVAIALGSRSWDRLGDLGWKVELASKLSFDFCFRCRYIFLFWFAFCACDGYGGMGEMADFDLDPKSSPFRHLGFAIFFEDYWFDREYLTLTYWTRFGINLVLT